MGPWAPPIIFAGGCALQGQKSWPKCAFYIFFCKIVKTYVKTYYFCRWVCLAGAKILAKMCILCIVL